MHAITDHIVDTYRWVTGAMEVDVDTIEENTFSRPQDRHRADLPDQTRGSGTASGGLAMTDDIEWLNSANQDLLSKEVRRRMRDVLDHQIVAAEQIAEYDDAVLAGSGSAGESRDAAKPGHAQDLGLGRHGRSADRDRGIYGMNFENTPELGWQWVIRRCCC